MIDEIAIADLGVIARTTLPLGPGFTAITGETGAGKTMVVTALGLLMGQRSDAGLVRHGAQRARVAGVVRTSDERVAAAVDECGGEIEDGELLLARTVASDGPSRASVGGVRAPVGTLAQLAQHLFCVHGQNEQLRLRSATQQRETLDRFGGSEIAAVLVNYQKVYAHTVALREEVAEITENREERRRLAERLRSETAEIAAVEPQNGELDELTAEIDRLGNSEALRQALTLAANAISGGSDDGFTADAQTQLGQASRALAEAAQYDTQLQPLAAQLDGVIEQLQQIVSEVLHQSDALDMAGPAALETAQQRLAALRALQRNYGPEISDVLEYYERASAQLLTLDDDDTRLVDLQTELAAAEDQFAAAAAELTAARTAAATSLGQAVTAELAALALPEAQITVTVQPVTPGKHGADEVQFMLRANAGASPRPLAKAASGGELSRIMLALEVVLAQSDPVPTFVFDEIDAGIGGAAAIEVGKRLAKLARHSQVIVVTHLAQVAAFANNHLVVAKDTAGGFTESSCRQLAGEARTQEIARLLSGITTSASALEHATELLQMGADTRETENN